MGIRAVEDAPRLPPIAEAGADAPVAAIPVEVDARPMAVVVDVRAAMAEVEDARVEAGGATDRPASVLRST